MKKDVYISPVIKELQEPFYLPPKESIRNMGICMCPCWCKCGCGALKAYKEDLKEKK